MTSVAYFANQFADRQGHGMSRYVRELHEALRAAGGADVTPVSAWTSLPPDGLAARSGATGLRLLPSGRRGTSWGWTFLGLPRIEWMMPGAVDVVHSAAMGYPIATGKPLVVTVHDIGPLTHPEYFSRNRPWLMRRALDQAVRRADRLVCISHATADEIRSLYGPETDARIEVVHSGVARRFFDDPGEKALAGLDLPADGTPFVLTAGMISPRKNVQGTMRAVRLALRDIPHHLVVTGGSGWDMEQVLAELDSPELRGRVHMLGYVSDDALRALYHRAAMYLHPSFYEGFGLTLLEAMAGGAPVVTSTVSSLPEVAGDAALTVDPTDTDAIAEAVRRIATEPGLAAALRKKGLARARSFTWDRTARAMIRIYEKVAAR